jgi:hypothetical protein
MYVAYTGVVRQVAVAHNVGRVHKHLCIETSLYKPNSCSSCLEYVFIFFLTAVRMETSRTACVLLDRVGNSQFFSQIGAASFALIDTLAVIQRFSHHRFSI